MYLHIGNNVIINTKSIIGIFDIENTSTSKLTKEYLSHKKSVINVNYDMPKTYIVCDENKKEQIYITSLSPSTLKKRFKQKPI